MTAITHLKHHQLDKKKWDTNLAKCSNALLYARSDYLDIVSPNWEAFVSDDYACLFPLTVKRKLGLTYISHPLFAQQLGLFFEGDKQDRTIHFVKEVQKNYRRFLVRMNYSNALSQEIQSIRSNFVLPMTSRDSMFKAYNQNTKRNLKKFIENDKYLTNEITSAEFIALKRGTSKATLDEKEWLLMERLIDHLHNIKSGFFLGIKKEQKLIACVFYTKWKDRICYLFSASNDQGLQRRASFTIVDQLIKEHLDSNLTLDFEGSMDENIARFFKGFGAQEEVYYEIKRSF